MLSDQAHDTEKLAGLPDRLTISPGLAEIRPPRTLFGDQYVFGMFVPRPEWGPLAPTESTSISRDGLLQEIVLVHPAPHLVAALRAAVQDIRSTLSPPQHAPIASGAIPHDLGQSVLDSALGDQVRNTRLISAAFRHVASGSPADRAHGSTTFYPDSVKAMGLHLDTWAHKRDFVRNGRPFRCIVNIGDEPRHVAFVNRFPEDISRLIEAVNPGLNATRLLDENPQEWAQRFLSAHREQPVLRLEVAPGEAYVMDTHACIHDGCAAHRTSPDTFVILSCIQDRE